MEFKDKNIETYLTKDGSIGLYNKALDEIYHDKFGAKKEAYEKFIEPILPFIKDKPLKLLDICYGIGYNTKTALKYLKNIQKIDCIEINPELIQNSPLFEFEPKINEIVQNNIKKPDFIFFHTDDLKKVIKKINETYDIIFYDGFAPYKQPGLWSEDLIKKIAEKMDYNSILTTYNHSKPVLNAFLKAGLNIGKIVKNKEYKGTIASFNSDFIIYPLDEFEIECLKTKSAITYKDKNLTLGDVEIIKNRELEINNSKLPSLSSIIKKRKIYEKSININTFGAKH